MTNTLSFRLLQAEEAPLLVEFVEAIYGKTYPNDLLYDSNKISHLIDNKQLIYSGAFDGKALVGHLATYYETLDDITADAITALVLPEYRGHNVMAQLSVPMWEVYEARNLAGLHLYAVTIHDVSQRKSLDARAVATGVLTHDWPGDFQAAGFEPVGLPRMPIVTMFMCFSGDSLPVRDVWIPGRHRAVLSDMYKAMGAKRTFQDTVRAPVGASKARIIEKLAQQLAILRIDTIGADSQEAVNQFLAAHQHLAVQYVDVPLTDPGAAQVIDQLEQQGWLFGCLLPERQHTDYLRMQLVEIPENRGSAVIDARARVILDHITKCA